MNDIIGEIVLAIGDDDFLPGDAIAAVRRALGSGARRAHVGAGLRLGELHGAHPFAGNELRQVDALELLAAVRHQRIDRRHGENRAQTEGYSRGVPHFQAGGVERVRQILAAPLRGRGNRVPAPLRPGAIGLLPSRCRRHRSVLEPGAFAVADRIEGSEDIGRELARLRKHRFDHVGGKVAVETIGKRASKTCAVVEREGNIGNRRSVGHRLFPDGTPVVAGTLNSCNAPPRACPPRVRRREDNASC